MFLYAINIFVILANIVLIFAVLRRGARNPANIVFSGILFLVTIWIVNIQFLTTVKELETLTVLGKFGFLYPLVIIYLFYLFASEFPKRISGQYVLKLVIGVATFLMSAITVFTNLVIAEVTPTTSMPLLKYGPLAVIFYLVVFAVILLGFRNIFLSLKNTAGVMRIQSRLLFTGFAISIATTLLTNILLPTVLLVRESSRLTPLNMVFLIFFSYYSIIRYKLFDIRLYLAKIAYYLFAALFVLISFYLVFIIDLILFGSVTDIRAFLIGIPIAIIFIIIYDIVRKSLYKRVQSILISPGYDSAEVIDSYSKEVSTELEVEKILESYERVIKQCFVPQKYKYFTVENFRKTFPFLYGEYFAKKKLEYFFIDKEYSSDTLKDIVEATTFTAFFIIKSTEIVGFLAISDKEGGSVLNSEEVRIILTISNITGQALVRAKLYKELATFNRNLQNKVDEATEVLNVQNIQLQKAVTQQRDMLDILGHELRTPLTIIRNALMLFKDKHEKKDVQEDDIEDLIRRTADNVKKEVTLLETLLTSAKIDNAKLDLKFEDFSLVDLVRSSEEFYESQAKERGLAFSIEYPKVDFNVHADRVRLQQVIDNLVSNASKYTNKGFVMIRIGSEAGMAKISVQDTGEGIPQEEIHNLGTKFYRVNNYTSNEAQIGDRGVIRPGGTGIGLYVVFQLIKEMKGEVKIQSELGKGSTFTVTIPKAS